MAQLSGVIINRLEGGLGRRTANTDGVFALVSAMPLASLNLEAHTAIKLIQVKDAEALGITPAYDANNGVLVHHQLSELFRLAPDVIVYLVGTEVGQTVSGVIEDILPTIRRNKDIKGLGFIGFDDTLDTLPAALEGIQASLVDELAAENRYIDLVLLEGKGGAEAIDPTNIPSLRELAAPQCSVVIAQDPEIAAIDEAYGNYAAVGAALGMLAVRRVNENLGSVNIQSKPRNRKGEQDYTLTDSAQNLWLSTALSDGTPTESLTKTDLKALNDKGYIYTASYEGYAGVFFSNSPTATTPDSDYAYIENNRVWNKAARLIRTTLIPEVRGVVKKDPQTGFIRSTTVSRWTGLLNAALERMEADDEISGFEVYIDPEQVVNDEAPVQVKAKIVADGIVHEFEIDLGLTNDIS
ncbi:DUF2586 domain-containing protein [Sinomicrobium kalidii]|uniref:DUF2586 family protein n=1 Tax=Sinomicrobium kalidii TaxID=2900738 RepID=UPI001E610441|nr:DUF2586 family protein [Sinomicrobium kalidii]UGU15211.1 DUF2586 domain-containing protein [Sinomicrobium kalidii]